MAERVLVVDDEAQITRVLRTALSAQGYDVRAANDPEEALRLFEDWSPDLIVTDLMMPGMSGVELCRRVRSKAATPIIVLSVRDQERSKVEALDAGADDYVTKPFSAPELLARVRAGLRRSARGAEQTSTLRLGSVEIDLARRSARGTDGSIHLTPLEYRVLECLARQAGMVVRQSQLLREVWGPDREDDARGLRVCIKYLRDKLEPDPRRPRFLVTEIGLGYRLYTDEAPQAGESGMPP